MSSQLLNCLFAKLDPKKSDPNLAPIPEKVVASSKKVDILTAKYYIYIPSLKQTQHLFE